MRQLFLYVLLLTGRAVAQIPPGYYDPAQGLTGEPLRQALNTIIAPHSVLAYSSLWDAFEQCDQRPDGTVWDIYTDVPGGTPQYIFNFGVDQCGNYNSEGDCFNREHSLPQSWFGSAGPMRTDLHHVYPTDGWVNNQRGNLPFGTTASPAYTSSNGTKRGPCSWPGYPDNVWEPIDAYKGDVARSQFYMLTCYLNEASSWTSPVLDGNTFVSWQESLLIYWHLQDPVSPKEIARNDSIYVIQGNRNPYVDNPQWVQSIWGPTASVEEPWSPGFKITARDGLLHIDLPEVPVDAQLILFDARGAELGRQALRGSSASLPFLEAAGIYVAVISDTRHQLVQRFAVTLP